MDRELVMRFLGTGGAVPSKDRSHPGLLVEFSGTKLLIDCGEGTQRRAMEQGVTIHDVDAVLLTHHHVDHVAGLLPLATTVDLLHGRRLKVYGPTAGSESALDISDLEVIEYREVNPGDEVEIGDLRVLVYESEHGVPTVDYRIETPKIPGKADPKYIRRVPPSKRREVLLRGERPYSLTKPGKISVYVKGDGRPADPENVRGCQVLVHEACFEDHEEAVRYLHSTHLEAAEVAREAGVDLLVLTHLSTKVDPERMREEAREVFPVVVVARDGLMVRVRR
ncbi:MBL fold metallo-hydrolase [Methanopyrus kandleri]|uniref:Ribonuclease Z n=2 Tax=Methanopyrus kandleri TaxID=2320 RepID=RNZ_METKA|nr:MBL fold metallo-hydrolase [Methanopyrus kandleri]Q8TWK0.1 RecName: Full=Ribonuclease Z; Short=RNase Z; AltName: Full=tRNA 3 endonuclease; AltName: Full=tRNase Z [Methanopyrus kandleri AV19]AAM02246.1 Metal-dependent hydrolase of the beta-lactamase superfamily [Methanopyrus kandleri AV19]HII69665.1 MBL fold metallo-hydrolase [Methanopyrus kandleri]